MENTTGAADNMADRAYTEAEIEAGYAEIAAEQKREAEERQAVDAALRKNSRRISPRNAGIDQFGNPIPGMWNVVMSTSEPYERPYERGVGLFNHFVDAENYCDAFDTASIAASGKTVNQYESTYCRIEFIPFGETNPVFHTLYTVETDREENSDQRTITEVSVEVISEKYLLKMISAGTNPLLTAIWENKSQAVYLDNGTEVSARGIVSSEIFSPLEVVSGEDYEGNTYSYVEGTERFLTFDPKNVALKKSE